MSALIDFRFPTQLTRARIDRIMTAAKASDRLLGEEELAALARLD